MTRFCITIEPTAYLRMKDGFLRQCFDGREPALTRRWLLGLHRLGKPVPTGYCSNQDITGRCRGHREQEFNFS